LCLLVWLAAGVLITADRRQTVNAEVARNNSLALAHEQGVAGALQWLAQLLRVVQLAHAEQGPALDLPGLLEDLRIDLSHINNLILTDAHGDVRQALHTGVANFADRPYFQRHRDEWGDEVLLGPALKGRITGRWSLTLSSRMVDAQGRFDGVVVVSLQPELFTGLFLSNTLKPGDSVGLLGTDGEIRAQREGQTVTFGGRVQAPALFDALSLAPQGDYLGTWTGAGPVQLVSYRRVQAAPLVVVVASSLDDALAPASTRATVILVSSTLASLLFLALAALGVRARQRQFDATRRIAVNETRYRWLFEHMLDGVLGLDVQGRIRAVNPAACELLGRPRDGLLGSTLWQYQADTATDRSAWLDSLARTGQARETCVFVQQDGGHVEAELSSVLPVVPGQGPEVGGLVTVVMRDISSRRQAEEAQRRQALAEQANAAKNRFMSRMSHELRTPLNAILGFAQLLERDPRSPLASHQQEQVQHVLRAGRHLLALINEVLDLSQVEGDRVRMQIQSVDWRALCHEVLASLSDEAARAGITLNDLEPEQAADCPPVMADPVRLRQVLLNLVSNAIKYGRPGGWVRLDLRVFAQTCRLEVCDNGLGMNPEQLNGLFQPFNRLGRERSGLPGTGIGLVISRRLVELMHGVLTVRSQDQVGSVFGVELPRVGDSDTNRSMAALPGEEVAQVSSVAGLQPAQKGRVLLVEDDLANQAVIRGCLGHRPGLVLDVAGSVAQARARVAVRLPDLALIDMMLPDGTGLEVMHGLRALAGPGGVRCVAVSANAMPDQVQAALAAGFDAYLTKPIQLAQLLAELDRSLASSG
jgi:PAS domain S-box-containing protein